MARAVGLILTIVLVASINQISGLPSKFSKSVPHSNAFSARNIGKGFANCLANSEMRTCFTERILESLDAALKDNSTWHLSDNIDIEPNPSSANFSADSDNAQNLSDLLANKIARLAAGRSIRMSVSPQAVDEGRKKKNKDKGGMAAMGGMAMVAMLAQMFLGKIILIAGGAFVMAKVALVFSVLSSLKKGSGGSTTEHVIYSGNSGGGHDHGGGHSGWHRSLPRFVTSAAYHTVQAEEPATILPDIYYTPDHEEETTLHSDPDLSETHYYGI